MVEPLIRSVSDTARWVAYHRATESDRPDSIFRDRYARRLAGERGELIGRKLRENAWGVAVRTYLFDNAIRSLLQREPVEMVVNLAAGFDSRPYRLDLPSFLQWVEVDLSEIVDTKRQILRSEKPVCKLETITENLGDEVRRRALFSNLNQRAQHIMVMSEGLLVYLDEEKVTSLSADLRAQPSFHYWLVEVTSPRALDWINRRWRHHFKAANALMAFAPSDWRKFYSERGWEVIDFEDLSQTALKMNRQPPIMRAYRFIGRAFPDWFQKQVRLWESGVALLRRV
jgi:methyltransferase (TIGR00027 family)